jgi:hypothetical protein
MNAWPIKLGTAALLIAALALAWWGWHRLDATLILMGTRLC